MRLLIKIGGTLLDETDQQSQVARQIASLTQEHEVVVVHGGGKQVTHFLEERGISSRFVDGLRVSDKAVIDAVTKVIAGTVNKRFVSALVAAGVSAVGLSGVDGTLTAAIQLNPDFGYVGQPSRTDARLFRLLLASGYLPVIACIAGDERGNIFNVNADQMAVSCALGWQADRLIFLTDVPGVKGAEGEVLAQLPVDEIAALVSSGIAYGGMQAKLDAARTALKAGVAEVIIAPGQQPDICRRVLSGEAVGTRVSLPIRAARSSAHDVG